MIIKLICWLWGHKVVHKAFTGNSIKGTNLLIDREVHIPCYKFQKSDFCTRCGKAVK